jgi:NosR/NirI family transcriptional regulator, nitrous oxide reductase regulator
MLRWAPVWACLLCWLLFGHPAIAESRLSEFLAQVNPAELVPGADRLGAVEGQPPVAAAMAGSRLLGYIYTLTPTG